MHYGLCFLTVNFPITWSHYSNNGLGWDSNCFNQRAPRPALSVQHTGQRCAGGCCCCHCGGGGSSQLIYKGSSSSSQPSVKTNIFLHLCVTIKMLQLTSICKYICIFPGLATSYLSWGQMPARCWQQLTCPHPGSPHMSQHWSTLPTLSTLVNIGQHWSALVNIDKTVENVDIVMTTLTTFLLSHP